jgi:hypothetical protein
MTIDELKAFAARVLDESVERMRKEGDLHQSFYLLHRAGGFDFVLATADVTNSEPAKAALARKLRARIAEAGDIEAVVMVSDIWQTIITTEQAKIQRALGLTVEQAGKAGLCTVTEAIMVTLESPIYRQLARQNYKREGAKIVLTGAPEIEDDVRPTVGFTGRFMNWFGNEARA